MGRRGKIAVAIETRRFALGLKFATCISISAHRQISSSELRPSKPSRFTLRVFAAPPDTKPSRNHTKIQHDAPPYRPRQRLQIRRINIKVPSHVVFSWVFVYQREAAYPPPQAPRSGWGAKPAARIRKALDFFALDASENVVLKRLGSAEESVRRLCHCSTRCQSQLKQLQRTNKIGKLKQTIPLRFYRLSKFDSRAALAFKRTMQEICQR